MLVKATLEFYRIFSTGPNKIPFYYGVPGIVMQKVGRRDLGFKGFLEIDYYSRETSKLIRPLSMVSGNAIWDAVAPPNKVSLKDIDSLWESSKDRYGVTLEKNGAYFNRRYITHPVNKYMILSAYNDNMLAGLAVLSYGSRVVKLLDLLWDGQSKENVSSLLEKAWSVTRKTGAVKLEMWLNNDEELVELLKSHGMVKKQNPYTLQLISCSFDDSLDADDIASRFCLTMGDSDMF